MAERLFRRQPASVMPRGLPAARRRRARIRRCSRRYRSSVSTRPTMCRTGSTTTTSQWADVVVATCDDACPVVPGKRYVNWQLPDPKERPLEEVRAIRDDIASRVERAPRRARPGEMCSTSCSCARTMPADHRGQAFFEQWAPATEAESAGQQPADAIWTRSSRRCGRSGSTSRGKPQKIDLEMQLHADRAITCTASIRVPMFRRWRTGIC